LPRKLKGLTRPARCLRSARATPPGFAVRDSQRRAVYSAALQQSEDLFDAAAAVSAFARPLPLFYAVSQAGRAIAAARSTRQWPIAGHGLAEGREATGWKGGQILGFRVKPVRAGGILGAVAETLGVRGLTGSVELGALWSALPGTSGPTGDKWLRALPVWPQVYWQLGVVLHIGAEHRGFVHVPAWVRQDGPRAIDELLQRYPAAAGASLEMVQTIIPSQRTPWGDGVPVRWPAPEVALPPDGPPPPEYVASQVRNRVPEYRYSREHWLVPFVGDANDELPPLLLWWVLLFGLSLLARYEPAAWRGALDPDSSALAVELEELLDEALDVTPALLYEALTGESSLLPPRA